MLILIKDVKFKGKFMFVYVINLVKYKYNVIILGFVSSFISIFFINCSDVIVFSLLGISF